MDAEFEQAVDTYYQPLYRFGLSLTRTESEAFDLAQQTFYLWATKGHQLRDKSKLKSWLFTTLHREFLGSRRRGNRFPHHEVSSVEHQLPAVASTVVNDLDGSTVMETLLLVEELYRAPLLLFYLQDHSYKEIAGVLDIPIGTVMSRLARGKAQLRGLLSDQVSRLDGRIVPLKQETKEASHG
jgi:RNA polymerase sigma-70 factor (ECF subfamily)